MGLLPGRARARPDRRRRGSEGRPIQERSRRIRVSGRERERDGSLPRRRHRKRKRKRKDARSVRPTHGQSQGVGRRRAYVREGRVAFARVRVDDDALRGLRRAVRATRKRETRQAARRRRAARGRAQAERRRGEGEVREDVRGGFRNRKRCDYRRECRRRQERQKRFVVFSVARRRSRRRFRRGVRRRRRGGAFRRRRRSRGALRAMDRLGARGEDTGGIRITRNGRVTRRSSHGRVPDAAPGASAGDGDFGGGGVDRARF
mmetsp:Transcript_3970/g.16857  ORF Transcript_3970/g.16857 Transcript_3970/m.16857 type:complete len:261 (+) Transcript_3970:316-1098(+)